MNKTLLSITLALACSPVLAADPAHCRLLTLAKLPIEFQNLQPTVHGTFNGVDLTLLMDTGASMTHLFQAGAEKAKLSLAHSDMIAGGVGGISQIYEVLIPEAQIGPSKGKVRLPVIAEANLPQDGLLGADYLFRTDLDLSLRDKQVAFFAAENCDDKFLAYWDPNAQWVPSYDSMANDMRQEVSIQIDGKTFKALLDTGAQRSILDAGAAAELGITPDSPGSRNADTAQGVGSEKMNVWNATFDSFAIGDELIRNPRLQIGPLKGQAHGRWFGQRVEFVMPDMLLGADFIRAHHLFFARSQHRLYFSYLGGPVFRLEPNAAELAEGARKNFAADMLGLARMLAQGREVEKDPVEALKWLTLAGSGSWAASHADFKTSVNREIAPLTPAMSEQDITEARNRAAVWKPAP